jgi:excisionase family DNA binding protein
MVEIRQDFSPSFEGFLKPADVAEQLAVSPSTVYNLIRKGDMQAVNVAPSDSLGLKAFYRIRQQWVDEFVRRRLAAAAAQFHSTCPETPRLHRPQGSEFIPNLLDS